MPQAQPGPPGWESSRDRTQELTFLVRPALLCPAPTHLPMHQHPQGEGDAELWLLLQPRIGAAHPVKRGWGHSGLGVRPRCLAALAGAGVGVGGGQWKRD